MRRTAWDIFRCVACVLVLLAVVQFVVITGWSMAAYPGGHGFDKSHQGYDFWLNSFSDLGMTESHSGVPNERMAAVFKISFAVATLAFVLIWLILPLHFPNQRRLGLWTIVTGQMSLFGLVGVSVFPSDTAYELHMASLTVAGVPGLTALILCTVAMSRDPACPKYVFRLTEAFLTLAVVMFILLILRITVREWTKELPILQKFLVGVGLLWMATAGAGLRPADSPVRRHCYPRQGTTRMKDPARVRDR